MAGIDLIEGIKKYRFGHKEYLGINKDGWHESKFKKKDENPELYMSIMTHQKHGTSVAINSVNFDKNYHFSTGIIIDEKEALRLIDNYMQSTQHLRKGKGAKIFWSI